MKNFFCEIVNFFFFFIFFEFGQDMVLLHHEVEVEFPDGKATEKHRATLLEFGKTKNGKMISAMALTVGIPAAVGSLVLVTASLCFSL